MHRICKYFTVRKCVQSARHSKICGHRTDAVKIMLCLSQHSPQPHLKENYTAGARGLN